MTPSYRFEVIGGDSLPIRVRYITGNAPFDFTGAKVSILFKWLGLTHVLSSEEGGIELGPDGWIKGIVSPEITGSWPSGRQVAYNVRLTDSNAEVRTLLTGSIDVTP